MTFEELHTLINIHLKDRGFTDKQIANNNGIIAAVLEEMVHAYGLDVELIYPFEVGGNPDAWPYLT